MKQTATIAAVFLGSLGFLGFGVGGAGIATNWVDPVGQIQAQDEAVYASTSLTMAQSGDWLTSYFMDRFALYKPPMLYWLSSASVRLFGNSRTALRLPSWVAGAVTVTVVFAWAWSAAPLPAALATALLLASSHLFFMLSRLAMTDALLVCLITVAMYAVHRDPVFERSSSVWLFGVVCGAAILTKAAAGVLPLAAAGGLWWSRAERPARPRLAGAFGIVAAIALPWHLFQIWAHPQWFWSEYVLQEHLTWGLTPPAQTSPESSVFFYARRLFLMEPVLVVLGTAALLFVRRHITIFWIAASAGAIFAFQYRNAAYLLPLLPALALIGAYAIPAKWSRLALAAAVGVVGVKMAASGQPWGLPFLPENVNASHAALDRYASLGRSAKLMIVESDDQFYASLLSLPKIHYAYLGQPVSQQAAPLDLAWLGVTMQASDFLAMPRLLPVYEARLRELGLGSTRALASTVWVKAAEDLQRVIASNPSMDFYLPRELGSLARDSHVAVAEGARMFLLARNAP